MRTRGIPLNEQPMSIIVVTTLTLFIPFTAVGYVLYCLATGQFTWLEIGLLVGFLVLSLLGTGLGFHRYFAHKSFTANRALKIALGIFGCAGGLGPISWFSAVHRRHHRFTDSEKDPHTPHIPGKKHIFSFITDTWMSAFGFSYKFGLFALHLAIPEKDINGISKDFRASVKDLTDDKDIRWVERRYYLWMILFFVIPGLVLLAITGEAKDFWRGMIWGGVARMGCNQLIFGFINVFGHRFGTQPYQSNDESRNLYWFALLSCGESLHNNHHAFPWTAKTTLAWWQLDINYYFLVLFKFLGWAKDVRIPNETELAKKKRAS